MKSRLRSIVILAFLFVQVAVRGTFADVERGDGARAPTPTRAVATPSPETQLREGTAKRATRLRRASTTLRRQRGDLLEVGEKFEWLNKVEEGGEPLLAKIGSAVSAVSAVSGSAISGVIQADARQEPVRTLTSVHREEEGEGKDQEVVESVFAAGKAERAEARTPRAVAGLDGEEASWPSWSLSWFTTAATSSDPLRPTSSISKEEIKVLRDELSDFALEAPIAPNAEIKNKSSRKLEVSCPETVTKCFYDYYGCMDLPKALFSDVVVDIYAAQFIDSEDLRCSDACVGSGLSLKVITGGATDKYFEFHGAETIKASIEYGDEFRFHGQWSWNLGNTATNAFIETLPSGRKTLPRKYTVATWIYWRESDKDAKDQLAPRALFRGTNGNLLIFVDKGQLGMYALSGAFQGTGYNIVLGSWQLVVVTGEDRSSSGTSGTSVFYVGDYSGPPIQVGRKVDRYAYGDTFFWKIGYPANRWGNYYQGPGHVASIHYWDRLLTVQDMETLWEVTIPDLTCGRAQDLCTLPSNPYESSTVNQCGWENMIAGTSMASDFGYNSNAFWDCGGGQEKVFYLDVPPGVELEIWTPTIEFWVTISMRIGLTCPGKDPVSDDFWCENKDWEIPRNDGIVPLHFVWTNSASSAQRVYFIVEAEFHPEEDNEYCDSNDHCLSTFGSFTLQWSLSCWESPNGCAQPASACTQPTTDTTDVVTWTKREKKRCNYPHMKASTTPYSSLETAKTVCENTASCYGVYDSGCNNVGYYYLCRAEYCVLPNGRKCGWATRSSACIHEKVTSAKVNICECDNGVAATGPGCTSDGAQICFSCNPGFIRSGITCVSAAVNGGTFPFLYAVQILYTSSNSAYCRKLLRCFCDRVERLG